jgi:hypothetical protein
MGIEVGLGTALLGGGVLGYLGSQKQASAAESAAQTQLQGTQDAARIQREMFDILNAQQAPFREAGYGALTSIKSMLPQFTAQYPAYKEFTAADLKSNLAPNYQFMLEQGLGATRQGMNVGSPGSNVTTAATKFAEDYASNAYQNALQNYMAQQAQGFNQYQTGLGNVYNRLASIAGLGQTATGQSAQLGAATGSNLSQLAVGGAGALAGGQVGAANAMAGGLSNIGSSLTLASLLNRPAANAATAGAASSALPSWIQYG